MTCGYSISGICSNSLVRKLLARLSVTRHVIIWLLLGGAPLVASAQGAATLESRQVASKDDPAEQRLAAVRNALLSHALNGELEIVTSAFVDESGKLHEATYMASNGTVRGVRGCRLSG